MTHSGLSLEKRATIALNFVHLLFGAIRVVFTGDYAIKSKSHRHTYNLQHTAATVSASLVRLARKSTRFACRLKSAATQRTCRTLTKNVLIKLPLINFLSRLKLVNLDKVVYSGVCRREIESRWGKSVFFGRCSQLRLYEYWKST